MENVVIRVQLHGNTGSPVAELNGLVDCPKLLGAIRAHIVPVILVVIISRRQLDAQTHLDITAVALFWIEKPVVGGNAQVADTEGMHAVALVEFVGAIHQPVLVQRGTRI